MRTHKITTILHSVKRTLLDLLLPRSPLITFLEEAQSHTVYTAAKHNTKELPGIISLFDYQDPLVKTLVWEIKFKGNHTLTRLAAELLYEHLVAEMSERVLFESHLELPVLIPVPLAPLRLQERGFNQTERLVSLIQKLDGGTNFIYATPVARIRETKSQTRLANRKERLENLQGAFAVQNIPVIKERQVVIIDDVVTTGSTIGEIRRVLMEAGAASVTGFTLAH